MRTREERLNEVQVSEIPEVAAYEEVQARIDAFVNANKAFFDYLRPLVEERNDKFQAAEKAVKSRQATCGNFHLYQFATKYHPEELYQALGHNMFLEVGGVLNTQTVYEVNKTRLEAAIKGGAIPPEVVARVKTMEPRFHKPEKIVLP